MSKPSPRISIHTCEGLFKKVEWEYEQLKQECGEYQTFNFILTAYHLYADWIETSGTREQKQRKNKLPTEARHIFFVLRDVANASKHWKLDVKAQKKQVTTSVSPPAIRDWFAYFSGSVMYVETNGSLHSVPELASLTVKTLRWILESNNNDFPVELEASLKIKFTPR